MMRKSLIIVIFSLLAVVFLFSCEDLPPDKYVPKYYVEALLIVDKPIENIIIQQSQPVKDSFDYKGSLISDANVKITDDEGNEYVLEFRDTLKPGFYYPDTTVLVKPQKKYYLEITLPDGSIATGNTMTPRRFDWITPPKDTIQYPQDTLNLPAVDSIKFKWENVSPALGYLLTVTCLDTTGYGKYLTPPTEEKNRRIERPWDDESDEYRDVANWIGPIPNNEVPVVWNGLKWYGLHNISLYVPDINFIRWFLQYQRSIFHESILTSVDGAIGVFGSASVLSKRAFVKKNQP